MEALSAEDPHLQPAARNLKRVEAAVGLLFTLGIAGTLAYTGVYWVGGQPQLEGLFLGGGLFLLGMGMSAWGKYLLPQGPFVEQRHGNASLEGERSAMTAAVVQRGRLSFGRRGFIGTLLGGGLGAVGLAALFPALRSLGPVPGKVLERTDWKAGDLLVNVSDGRPVHVDDLEVGGSLTVLPQGYLDNDVAQAIDQTILVRAGVADITTKAGRGNWGPKGYLAYSKVCTHAGCPVGLYQEQTQQLLCPCHQSLFDVLDGAEPVFGPAPRPLPQLPLMIDAQGYLRASSGYHEAVGPGFWERSTPS
jgi:ubiquinol-cytochrome c reductase iron-sulfur subunit